MKQKHLQTGTPYPEKIRVSKKNTDKAIQISNRKGLKGFYLSGISESSDAPAYIFLHFNKKANKST
jgi:hypothetical protein